jgi:hypothetical protein
MLWTPLALADLHLDLLYERDAAGLLLRSRDPAVAAPAFHLVRTVDGNRWLVSAALSERQRARLQEALSREPVVASLESRPPVPSGIRALLARERPNWVEQRGPAFLFPDPLPLISGPGELLRDCRSAPTVLELSWIRAVPPSAHPLAVVRNSSGEIVSVCHSARVTESGAEAGVETAPGYRGSGFAGAVVLVWATAVITGGKLPLYSTHWANHASLAVARKLGLAQYGEDCQSG